MADEHYAQRLTATQLDISEDDFMSLMDDSGTTKDDVKVPDGEVGEKIIKLFKTDEKDTSKSTNVGGRAMLIQTDVVVLTAMGEESAIDAKEAPK